MLLRQNGSCAYSNSLGVRKTYFKHVFTALPVLCTISFTLFSYFCIIKLTKDLKNELRTKRSVHNEFKFIILGLCFRMPIVWQIAPTYETTFDFFLFTQNNALWPLQINHEKYSA